jgi:hypothetical protein
MIGRPEWFKRRKYGGWGVSPKKWQGWLYILIVLGVFAVFQALPFWEITTRIYFTIGWAVFLFLDVGHIMVTLNRDEREFKIEALSERNAAWVMMMVLVIAVLYETFNSALAQEIRIDWFLVAALFLGMIVKTISNYVYERRAL